MKSLNETLSELFEVEPTETSSSELVTIDSEESSNTENIIDSDSEFARKNIRELIIKGNKAVDELLHIATVSEVPRAFEVTATLLKNLADMNKDLLELHKRKKELVVSKEIKNSNDMNINQAVVFTGSTHHLMKLLKEANGNSG